jgi:hypothetical protein
MNFSSDLPPLLGPCTIIDAHRGEARLVNLSGISHIRPHQKGRSIVAGIDIQKALLECRIPTDRAPKQAFGRG